MKNIEQLNNAFVKGFLKDWRNLSKKESESVLNRKYSLNKNFLFTPLVIQQLGEINDLLRKEELRIKEQALKIYSLQESMLKELVIDDYEMDTEIHCWNNNHYKLLQVDFEGNPFYKDYSLHIFGEEKSELYFTENWNVFENNPNHSLAKEYHCYLFHHLTDHTALAWEDILQIDDIKVEIVIRNHYFSAIENK